MSQRRAHLVNKKMVVSIDGSTVTLEIICADEYEATVLHDDILERMRNGTGIQLSVESHAERGGTENKSLKAPV
jgi:hypothetical protein